MTASRPLAAFAAELARLDADELPFLTQIDVRADRSAVAALGFPGRPDTTSAWNDADVLWLGPDEWLVVADAGREAELLRALEAALGSNHHSILDVSAKRAVFELRGPDRRVRLATGCPLDLHPRSWGSGDCAQTVFGAAQVLLHERSDVTRVFVRPSFAGYVIGLLDAPV
ncbi:MAG TPA: sarcosine oxidase subunit gamma family protein [Actinomycetota bacterium]|nr:sarcosine oxidase subunit gamma family protein [Actinomycetota bacterium]